MLLRKQTLVVSLLILSLLGVACTEKKIKRASVAIRQFAVSLEAVQTGLTEINDAGFLDDDDYNTAQDVIADVAVAGQEAVQAISVAKDSKSALVHIESALDSVDRLLNESVLKVKNPERRQSLTALVLALRGAIVTVQVFLQ